MFGEGSFFYLGYHRLQSCTDTLVGLFVKVFSNDGIPLHDTLMNILLLLFGLFCQKYSVTPFVMFVLFFSHKALGYECLDDPCRSCLVYVEVGGEFLLGLTLCLE